MNCARKRRRMPQTFSHCARLVLHLPSSRYQHFFTKVYQRGKNAKHDKKKTLLSYSSWKNVTILNCMMNKQEKSRRKKSSQTCITVPWLCRGRERQEIETTRTRIKSRKTFKIRQSQKNAEVQSTVEENELANGSSSRHGWPVLEENFVVSKSASLVVKWTLKLASRLLCSWIIKSSESQSTVQDVSMAIQSGFGRQFFAFSLIALVNCEFYLTSRDKSTSFVCARSTELDEMSQSTQTGPIGHLAYCCVNAFVIGHREMLISDTKFQSQLCKAYAVLMNF